jgi:hypothetical protein
MAQQEREPLRGLERVLGTSSKDKHMMGAELLWDEKALGITEKH